MHPLLDSLPAALLDACRQHYRERLVALALFGSMSRGTPRPDSDVDALVVAEPLPDGRVARAAEFLAVEGTLATWMEEARLAGLSPVFSPAFKTSAELGAGSPALKGMLRHVGIEPPKWHDVGSLLQEYPARFPPPVAQQVDGLADISGWLRKEREFSFYGDIDFIPTEKYSREDAERALNDARRVVAAAELLIPAKA